MRIECDSWHSWKIFWQSKTSSTNVPNVPNRHDLLRTIFRCVTLRYECHACATNGIRNASWLCVNLALVSWDQRHWKRYLLLSVWYYTPMDSTASGWPCVCILWRGGVSCSVFVAFLCGSTMVEGPLLQADTVTIWHQMLKSNIKPQINKQSIIQINL